MSRFSKAKIATASAVATLAVAAPVALAAPAQAAGGTAPACVTRSVETSTRTVYLSNVCDRTMRVTVVYRSGAESPCFTMSVGASLKVRYSSSQTYARTAVC